MRNDHGSERQGNEGLVSGGRCSRSSNRGVPAWGQIKNGKVRIRKVTMQDGEALEVHHLRNVMDVAVLAGSLCELLVQPEQGNVVNNSMLNSLLLLQQTAIPADVAVI